MGLETTNIVAVFPDGSVMWSIDDAQESADDPAPVSSSSPPTDTFLAGVPEEGPVQYHYHYHLLNGSRWLLAAFVAGGAIALLATFIWRAQNTPAPELSPNHNQARARVVSLG